MYPDIATVKVYIKRGMLRIKMDDKIVTIPKDCPQLKKKDPLESMNGKLVAEANVYPYYHQYQFWVRKSKLNLNSSFPKTSIISSIYKKSSTYEPKHFYEFEMALAELDTLHKPNPSLADFIMDQLNNLQTNVQKIWTMLTPKKESEKSEMRSN